MNRSEAQDLMIDAENNLLTTDPHKANEIGRALGLYAIERSNEAARLELSKRDLLADIQGRMMAEGMAKTPAEAAARRDPEYMAVSERQRKASEDAETARVNARYFNTRASILVRDLEVANV